MAPYSAVGPGGATCMEPQPAPKFRRIGGLFAYEGLSELGNRLVPRGHAPRDEDAPGRGRLMTQFQYSTGSFRVSRERTTHTPQQRAVGLVFAVAMEASIVYALLVTLGWVEAPEIPRRLHAG